MCAGIHVSCVCLDMYVYTCIYIYIYIHTYVLVYAVDSTLCGPVQLNKEALESLLNSADPGSLAAELVEAIADQ